MEDKQYLFTLEELRKLYKLAYDDGADGGYIETTAVTLALKAKQPVQTPSKDKIRLIFKPVSIQIENEPKYCSSIYWQGVKKLFDKAISELSNLISNQDKIDCYSKTGEVISNDKEIRVTKGEPSICDEIEIEVPLVDIDKMQSNDKEIRAIEINSTDNKAKNLTGTNLSNDKGEVIASGVSKFLCSRQYIGARRVENINQDICDIADKNEGKNVEVKITITKGGRNGRICNRGIGERIRGNNNSCRR